MRRLVPLIEFLTGPEVTWASVVVFLLGGLMTYLMTELPAAPVESGPEKPNVVILVVDALRPDHLGCYGYGRATSPNIDGLASTGILFETAVCHAPWTKSSFSSMLTALYPFQHGVTDWSSVMPDTVTTLPEVLAQHGYTTACVMNTVALSGRFQVLRGFEEVVVTEKVDRDAFKTSGDAIEIMKRAGQPFFLMVHYSDVHLPYRPPWRYIDLVRSESDIDPFTHRSSKAAHPGKRPSEAEIARDLLAYDGCIRLADDGIGTILDYLDQAGISQTTLLILTADHGEAFWEHGTATHAASVYDEVMRVPLIISYPGVFPRPRRIVYQVRHIDLLPTILNVAGITEGRVREGTSLVDLMTTGERTDQEGGFLPTGAALCECTRPRAPATRGIRTNDWKLIAESITATWQLYDLRNDPGETTNLSGTGLAIEDSLLRMIRRVPGIRLGGWRIGFSGAGGDAVFHVEAVVPQRARLSSVRRFAERAQISVDMRSDSTGFSFEAKGEDLNPLVFDVKPRDSRVRFKVNVSGESAPHRIYIGESGEMPTGEELILAPDEAFGLPGDFQTSRLSGKPGAYIWWMPGETMAGEREGLELTPEETKRLRALGYIQ